MIDNELQKRIISSIVLIPISIFFIVQGSGFFIFFLGISFIVTSYEWLKMSKNFSKKIFGIIFLLFSFYLAYLLRTEQGYKIFILIILISILTDIGGFIFGKIFKGPKLTKISPKKTYSGAIGSFILSVVGSLIFIEYFDVSKTYIYYNYQNFESSGINLNLFIRFRNTIIIFPHFPIFLSILFIC